MSMSNSNTYFFIEIQLLVVGGVVKCGTSKLLTEVSNGFPILHQDITNYLKQASQLLVEVAVIVSRHKTFPHQQGKLVPCLNRPFTYSPPVDQNLIIPINSIAREFSSSKSYFPKFRKVSTIKHMLNFPSPLKKSIRIIFTIKRWNFQFQSVQTIISTTNSSKQSKLGESEQGCGEHMIRGVGEDIATASKMVQKIWRKLKSQCERRR